MLFATAEEIPLEQRFVEVFSGESSVSNLSELNPTGLVPTLVDGEFVLTGAAAILRYLADKTSSPAYPTEPKARARVDEALDWFQTKLGADFARGVVYPQAAPDHFCPMLADPAALAWHRERSLRWFALLDANMLREAPYVCGETITLADYFGATTVSLGELINFDLTPWPRVAAWMERIKAHTEWGLVNAAFYGWRSVVQETARAA